MLEILLSLALATIPGFALALAMYIRLHQKASPFKPSLKK